MLIKIGALILGVFGSSIAAFSIYKIKQKLSDKHYFSAAAFMIRALLGGLVGYTFIRVFLVAGS